MIPTGPPRTIRVALADFRWPIDPAVAETRDETTLARTLYATPLRVDSSGRVGAGLCSAWRAGDGFRTWRLTCRSAPPIAAGLRRVARLEASPARPLFRGARITAPSRHTLVVALPFPWRRFPYALTAVAAAPRELPGPFRLVSGSPGRVVVRRGGRTVVFHRLDPVAAVREFRAGRLDEAPVPVGDTDVLRSRFDVRRRELLALDAVVFRRAGDERLRRAYRDTADRADYEALLDTSLALGVTGRNDKPDPAAFRRALKAIPELPRRVVRIARRPALAYGGDILYGQWREAGLGPELVGPAQRHDAELARVLAPYPQAEALPAALVLGHDAGERRTLLKALAHTNQKGDLARLDGELHADARVIPIAWVTDARLVSRRLTGWREDLLGNVDYTRVQTR
jgi:hypothetical protein